MLLTPTPTPTPSPLPLPPENTSLSGLLIWLIAGGGSMFLGQIVKVFYEWSKSYLKERNENRVKAQESSDQAGEKIQSVFIEDNKRLREDIKDLRAEIERERGRTDEWQERFRVSELENTKLKMQLEYGKIVDQDYKHHSKKNKDDSEGGE